MVVYIYCSIGAFLSERTMKESKGGELGRDLLLIIKGSVDHERKYHPLYILKGDHTIRGDIGIAHDYKEKS